ncbi:Zinc finger CCCH domain-containing protein 59 [Cardamine amara subsp. amara]|uniref:Zinc finger CCCH domain-containing protein 59 n=1 Tax=Cardamine amara subsp. amara TaxID=228776 RepID=A0ABD0ZL67_CARAN
MFSGIKIIPRDEVRDGSSSEGEQKQSKSEKDRRRRKNKDRKEERKGEGSKRDGKKIVKDGDDETVELGGDIVRKKMGLDWMLPPVRKDEPNPSSDVEEKFEESVPEVTKVNPRELNPYLKDNGSGYPEEESEKKHGKDQLLPTSVVGDGGVSWRMKALKRAKEQAARDGQNLEEVVGERWGSLGNLVESVASQRAAPSRAHLNAINNRRRVENEKNDTEKKPERISEKGNSREYLKDDSLRRGVLRAPKTDSSLSWGKRKGQMHRNEDSRLISEAAAHLNKFSNDGNFMKEMLSKQKNESVSPEETRGDHRSDVETNKDSEETLPSLSVNQLAAKALQLRMKGKHEEAQKLMDEAERLKAKQAVEDDSSKDHSIRTAVRYPVKDMSGRRKNADDNTDMHLAKSIIQNKQYKTSNQAADDEYDYGDAPSKKSRKRESSSNIPEKDNRVKRIMTQQERCLFCFENPKRPKHLVVSIGSFTYLMLPQHQPLVPGHCCILPMQHEAASRSVDDNVWEEIRNFKKCLIMMYAKEGKEAVFLETVIGLSQQRRHCLIECIPIPQEIAKEGPLYFKKAIDEAESEWSQHNAKKLIDTSVKGLRNSIPKNFPYFHVEFGLDKGFAHVIDDEQQFNSNLGLNVIRGMLELPEEDMYRRRRHESVESQKKAVVSFAREWEHFDWTKQLD